MQRRPVVALLLALAACREPGLRPVSDCGAPCGDNQEIGTCRRGTWVCPADGEPYCSGGRGPEAEVCDGADNDCDGSTDEGSPPDAPKWYRDADGDGFGTRGYTTACRPPPGYVSNDGDCDDQDAAVHPGGQEYCNGRDDDCDGQVDEPENLPVEVCYTLGLTHPSLGYDPCRPGVYRCVRGQKICHGEVLPQAEVCDGVDQDCDGLIDEGAEVEPNIDVVVIVDNSCSMSEEQQEIGRITTKFQQKYSGRAGLRGAYVGAPSNDPNDGPVPVVVQNFTDFGTLATAIQTRTGINGHWFEPTATALGRVADPQNPLGLNWRAGAVQAVVVVTDEEPQDQEYQPNLTPAETNKLLMRSYPYPPLPTWVFTTTYFWPPWQTVVNGTGGGVYDITSWNNIEATLDGIVKDLTCRKR